jgi:hypothetical protein
LGILEAIQTEEEYTLEGKIYFQGARQRLAETVRPAHRFNFLRAAFYARENIEVIEPRREPRKFWK